MSTQLEKSLQVGHRAAMMTVFPVVFTTEEPCVTFVVSLGVTTAIIHGKLC